MRKTVVCVLTGAALAVSMIGSTACFAEEQKTFTVGFDAEYPPYGYMDENGEYTGFDLELAQAVCDLEGWELVKTPIDWDSKDMELNSGSIDCIWNGFTMNGREEDYTWSKPYVDNSQVIVVPESSDVTDLSGLAGKIVGVQAASAALELLSEGGDQADLAATFGSLQGRDSSLPRHIPLLPAIPKKGGPHAHHQRFRPIPQGRWPGLRQKI